jgi:hypothetical protein
MGYIFKGPVVACAQLNIDPFSDQSLPPKASIEVYPLALFKMKFTALAIATLLPFAVLSAPTAELGGEDVDSVESVALGERAITGTVDADALKYRRCPRTSCDAVGQYPRGTRVTMECFTTTSTTTVNGDRYMNTFRIYLRC